MKKSVLKEKKKGKAYYMKDSTFFKQYQKKKKSPFAVYLSCKTRVVLNINKD